MPSTLTWCVDKGLRDRFDHAEDSDVIEWFSYAARYGVTKGVRNENKVNEGLTLKYIKK